MKKQNIPQDAAWKGIQYTKDSLLYSCTFRFQNGQNSEALVFDSSKKECFLVHDEFIFFLMSSFHYLICFIKKKTKYTTRCSVKSSTIYKKRLILQLHFLFSKSTKFCAANFLTLRKSSFLLQDEFFLLLLRLMSHIEGHNWYAF